MTDRANPLLLPSPRLAAAIVISILTAAGALVACSSDGTTPKCSELHLYDITQDGSPDAHNLEARDKAAQENCVTLPGTGTGASTTNPPPDSGTD